jgi:hypothetical protein
MALFGAPNVQKMVDARDIDGLIKAVDYPKDADIRWKAISGLRMILLELTRSVQEHRAQSLDVSAIERQVSRIWKVFVLAMEHQDPKIREAAVLALWVFPFTVDLVVMDVYFCMSEGHFASETGRASLDRLLEGYGEKAAEPLVFWFFMEPKTSDFSAAHLIRIGAPAVAPLARTLMEELTSPIGGHYQEGFSYCAIIRILTELARRAEGEARTSAIQAIHAALQSKRADVRRAAIMAVGELGDPAAVSLLEGFLEGEDAESRRLAFQAIVRLQA